MTKDGVEIIGTSTHNPLPYCLHNGEFTSHQDVIIDNDSTYECAVYYDGLKKSTVAKFTSGSE